MFAARITRASKWLQLLMLQLLLLLLLLSAMTACLDASTYNFRNVAKNQERQSCAETIHMLTCTRTPAR